MVKKPLWPLCGEWNVDRQKQTQGEQRGDHVSLCGLGVGVRTQTLEQV